jgi:hypothetical protein
MPVGLTSPVKTDRDPKATVDVVFSEANHFNGKPVIETLCDLANVISQLVTFFETALAKSLTQKSMPARAA